MLDRRLLAEEALFWRFDHLSLEVVSGGSIYYLHSGRFSCGETVRFVD